MKYFTALLGSAMVLISSTVSIAQESTQGGPLTVEDLMKIVVDFQTIINKPAPNMDDFGRLYKGEGEGEREMWVDQLYCTEVLKLEYDTPPCTAALNELFEYNKSSLYLLNIKNLISDNTQDAIRLFVDPSIKSCSNYSAQNPYLPVKVVAIIGTNKFKSLTLYLACNSKAAATDRLNDVEIRGKSVSVYPITIKKPPQKSK